MSTQAMVIGGTSFQSDIIRKAGGVNVFQDVEDAYPVVSLDDVKAKDPDVIILNRDEEEAAIQWFLKQPGWSELRAAQEGRLMSISCDYICHPNTRIDKTVEMLARRFYPERFQG
jgi:iron complex transport system substrate-binding protein